MSAFEVIFTLEKATKNSLRYQEDVPKDGLEKIGALYVKKWNFQGEAPPQKLTVVVNWR